MRILVGNGKTCGFNSIGVRVSFGKEGFGDGVADSAVGEMFGLSDVIFGLGGHGMSRILEMRLGR